MINIAEILKDVPEGTSLFSMVEGEVKFVEIDSSKKHPIIVENWNGEQCSYDKYGKFYFDIDEGECVLFPSKENRDWSTFKVETPPFAIGSIICNKDNLDFVYIVEKFGTNFMHLRDHYGTPYHIELDKIKDFEIKRYKPYDAVLVWKDNMWIPDIVSVHGDEGVLTIGGKLLKSKDVIPFEGNKVLLESGLNALK